LKIEFIFAIPGIGRYYVQSVQARDYSVTMGLTVLLSVIIVVVQARQRRRVRQPRERQRDASPSNQAEPGDVVDEELLARPHGLYAKLYQEQFALEAGA
jgi:hypothetical protein